MYEWKCAQNFISKLFSRIIFGRDGKMYTCSADEPLVKYNSPAVQVFFSTSWKKIWFDFVNLGKDRMIQVTIFSKKKWKELRMVDSINLLLHDCQPTFPSMHFFNVSLAKKYGKFLSCISSTSIKKPFYLPVFLRYTGKIVGINSHKRDIKATMDAFIISEVFKENFDVRRTRPRRTRPRRTRRTKSSS
jgi:hypothetical protein